MIYSFEDALTLLTEFQQSTGHRAIFRGESRFYARTLPSIERLEDQKKIPLQMIIPNLVRHICDSKLQPFLENNWGFIEYQGQEFGANDLIDPVDSCEPRHTAWGVTALMQHYGIPTEWIDYTKEPKIAMLFASGESDSETGYVYYGDYWELEHRGVLIDLDNFIFDLKKIFPLPESRPEKQRALAFRPQMRLCGRAGMNQICFKKKEFTRDLDSKLFPKDPMRTWFMGQLVDYSIDYTQRSRAFYKEKDKPNPDEITNALTALMDEYSLWY